MNQKKKDNFVFSSQTCCKSLFLLPLFTGMLSSFGDSHTIWSLRLPVCMSCKNPDDHKMIADRNKLSCLICCSSDLLTIAKPQWDFLVLSRVLIGKLEWYVLLNKLYFIKSCIQLWNKLYFKTGVSTPSLRAGCVPRKPRPPHLNS